MSDKNKFQVDWRFSIEDFIYNAEEIVGKLPVKYVGERQVYGDWMEVVEVDGSEQLFPLEESHESLISFLVLINKHLPDKTKEFDMYDTDGDSYGFKLVEKTLKGDV